MNAGEAFKAGRLREAIDAQIADVKAHPADHGKRLFLFELAAFAGDLERARRQIEAVRYDEPELDLAAQTYRKLLDAEEARRRLFKDGLQPGLLADAPDHAVLRLEAVNRLREGRPSEAAEILERANDLAPVLKGALNGKAFEGLRDGDDLFGTVLEVMAQGRYFWLPLEQVDTLKMNAPQFPRDLLWLPAKLLTTQGEEGDVFLPALYPGTHEHPDDRVRLGRATDWNEAEGAPARGAGLRTFLVGEDAVGLLEWRELRVLTA